jgi:hypothetical protein
MSWISFWQSSGIHGFGRAAVRVCLICLTHRGGEHRGTRRTPFPATAHSASRSGPARQLSRKPAHHLVQAGRRGAAMRRGGFSFAS